MIQNIRTLRTDVQASPAALTARTRRALLCGGRVKRTRSCVLATIASISSGLAMSAVMEMALPPAACISCAVTIDGTPVGTYPITLHIRNGAYETVGAALTQQ